MATSTHICPTCNQEFIVYPKHPDVKYCSHKCHGEARKQRVQTTCQNCGILFEQKPSENKQFCSRKCANHHNNKINPLNHKQCICEWCNKEFITRHDAQGRFCSSQCRSEFAATQRPKGIRKPEIHITMNCKVCNKPYQTTTHHVRLRGSSCCSRECVAILQSQLKRKDGNPNYRGGTILYRGANWGRQSRKALKRDGDKCQICHKKVNRKKHDYGIHHIIAFRLFDGNYVQANQLSNLITLCSSCHARVEHGLLPCPKPLPLIE